MRGRKPSVLSLAPSDEDRLHTTAHSDSLPWYQVRRARILLALAAGQRKRDVAAQMECGVATVWRACERYRRDGLEGLLADGREGRSGRLEQITPVQRAQIVELACLEPIAKGLHITHWSSEDLARQAVEDGIVGSISPATVRRLLHDVDLQPHRTRYWKTARLDARFKERGNDSPNPLRSSLCLVISYRCICVFFCIAGTAYRSDLLCGKDVKDGGPCPPYENSFGPGLRTYVESGDCTNGLGESLRLGAVSQVAVTELDLVGRFRANC